MSLSPGEQGQGLGHEGDPVRNKVDEYLSGCDAVREGLFRCYWMLPPKDRRSIVVTPNNVNEIEGHIRDAFGDRFPDLIGRDVTVDADG